MPEGNFDQGQQGPIRKGVEGLRKFAKELQYSKLNPIRPRIRVKDALPSRQNFGISVIEKPISNIGVIDTPSNGIRVSPDASPSRVRVIEPQPAQTRTTPEIHSPLTSEETNAEACKHFLETIRNPNNYRLNHANDYYLTSNLGFLVEKHSVEKGWFDLLTVLNKAEWNYNLPLAIYVDQRHARLVVKGPYKSRSGENNILVYDPMLSGFKEIPVSLDSNGFPIKVYCNSLASPSGNGGKFPDIYSYLQNPQARMLEIAKTSKLQNDSYNCIPISFFVGAMLSALDPQDTAFKRDGIERFKQDFGVEILPGKQLLSRPRIRIVPMVRIV